MDVSLDKNLFSVGQSLQETIVWKSLNNYLAWQQEVG